MRPRSLLVLFLLVVALGSFIWLFERELPSSEQRREQSGRLVVLDVEEVNELELTAGGQSLRFERSAGDGSAELGWLLVDPPLGRADSDEVEGLLEEIAGLRKERTLEDGAREDLGLASPRAEIRIGDAADALLVKLGAAVPASENTIAEVGTGPPFFVVRDALFEDIARGPDAWRSRDAIPVQGSAVQQIDVLTPANGVSLERTEAGFRLLAPVPDEADGERVADLLEELTELEIEEFLDEPDLVDGLDQPAAALRLTVDGRSEPISVSISGVVDSPDDAEPSDQKPLVTVRVDGSSFRARTDLGEQVALAADGWRSPKWSNLKTYEMDQVVVVQGEEELRLERSEGQWHRQGEEIDYSTVDGFLSAVVALTGTPVGASAGESGSAPVEVEITLRTDDREDRLRLVDGDEGYLAERDGREARLRVLDAAVGEVLSKLSEVRAAPALDAAEPAEGESQAN